MITTFKNNATFKSECVGLLLELTGLVQDKMYLNFNVITPTLDISTFYSIKFWLERKEK